MLVFLLGIHNTCIIGLLDTIDYSRYLGEWSSTPIVPEDDTVFGNTINVPQSKNSFDRGGGTANRANKFGPVPTKLCET